MCPTEPPPVYVMTREEQELQALSFAYGNLCASTNHRPTLEAFRSMALNRGKITDGAFDAWASALQWR